jgi:hypothetical protein
VQLRIASLRLQVVKMDSLLASHASVIQWVFAGSSLLGFVLQHWCRDAAVLERE